MSEIDRSSVPRRREGLSLRRGSDGATIVDAGSEVVALDDTAAALWELCDGETRVEEITDAVCTVWDVTQEVARRDVRSTLTVLRDAGVLDWDERR